MIDLIFVACLTASPAQCREEAVTFLPDISLSACMVIAQPRIAQWVNTHPGYSIQRWRCEDASGREFKA